MVEVEIDGKKVQVAEGSMVMHAANALDIYVPHFCYHKKLSIAANCRMCLVDIEKAPKPMPACATPVTNGMKVYTRSEKAIAAQKGVMEFLLINHPLDCPICDQGGECQLQDLAVGYGGSSSRYGEEKRVVFHKPMGPLISAEEMARCIHCTRCVRFGQEVAGIMELGMAGRGEHSEIMSFVGRSVESELSGNMIDVCPVGALTSKPFRYTARTWELTRRRSVSPHDSLGSNLVVQVKADRVMRVLPFENEAINECWLSDRDRFSYEGLNSPERLTRPMLKQGAQWQVVDWPTAIDYVAKALNGARDQFGAESIAALASGQASVEELYLLARLVRDMGSEHIDFRARQRDFSLDTLPGAAPWLGMGLADLHQTDRLLLVGSYLRNDHPLLAARIRQAVKRGMQVSVVHAADEALLMPIAAKAIVAASRWPVALARIAVALAAAKSVPPPVDAQQFAPDAAANAIAAGLAGGKAPAILLGNAVLQTEAAGVIAALAHWIATHCGARWGWLGDSANAVGGYIAGAVPRNHGLNARAMFEQPRNAYLLYGIEPELDTGNPLAAKKALTHASSVIALTAFRSAALQQVADCMLPIAPFTETSGSFINCEGRLQSFNGVVRPLGETRPGWKVLRVLANALHLSGFDYDSSEAVLTQALAGRPIDQMLGNRAAERIDAAGLPAEAGAREAAIERIADVPIYFCDPIVRRAAALSHTAAAGAPHARMHPQTIAALGLRSGQRVRAVQGAGAVQLELLADSGLAPRVLRIAQAHADTAALGVPYGPITLGPAQ